MIKISFLFLIIVLSFSFDTIAQGETKLTIPSTPAFSILNFEPTSVMRPTNNKDFGADLLNAYDEEGKLLMNLGLEVTPYWLKSRPTLTQDDYLNPTFKQTFRQSFNVSAATVNDSITGNNKLGTGVRFKLLNGIGPLDEFSRKKNELKAEETIISLINAVNALIGGNINSRVEAIEFIVNNLKDPRFKVQLVDIEKFRNEALERSKEFDDTNKGIKDFIEALKNERLSVNGELIKEVVELTKKRKGLVLELAGASSFITSNSEDIFERAGIWLNASSYFTPTDAWAFTTRYLFSNGNTKNDTSSTNFDAGLSYIKEQPRYNVSIEGMLRWYRAEFPDFNDNNDPIERVEKDFTYRLAVQGSYRLSRDVSFSLSIGKDFDSPFISRSGIFSIFGFNYSIFSKEKVKITPAE